MTNLKEEIFLARGLNKTNVRLKIRRWRMSGTCEAAGRAEFTRNVCKGCKFFKVQTSFKGCASFACYSGILITVKA